MLFTYRTRRARGATKWRFPVVCRRLEGISCDSYGGQAMFQFLFGGAFGAAGYWAWQSFGRDLLGMGGDQDTTYGGFSSTSPTYPSVSTSSSTGESGSAPSSSTTSSSIGGSASSTTP